MCQCVCVPDNYGASVAYHRPVFDSGVANPDVGMGGLTDIATIGLWYDCGAAEETCIVDFNNPAGNLSRVQMLLPKPSMNQMNHSSCGR